MIYVGIPTGAIVEGRVFTLIERIEGLDFGRVRRTPQNFDLDSTGFEVTGVLQEEAVALKLLGLEVLEIGFEVGQYKLHGAILSFESDFERLRGLGAEDLIKCRINTLCVGAAGFETCRIRGIDQGPMRLH